MLFFVEAFPSSPSPPHLLANEYSTSTSRRALMQVCVRQRHLTRDPGRRHARARLDRVSCGVEINAIPNIIYYAIYFSFALIYSYILYRVSHIK